MPETVKIYVVAGRQSWSRNTVQHINCGGKDHSVRDSRRNQSTVLGALILERDSEEEFNGQDQYCLINIVRDALKTQWQFDFSSGLYA